MKHLFENQNSSARKFLIHSLQATRAPVQFHVNKLLSHLVLTNFKEATTLCKQ